MGVSVGRPIEIISLCFMAAVYYKEVLEADLFLAQSTLK